MADGFEDGKRAFFDGVAHYQAGRHAEAANAFERSLAAVPGRASTLANLGAARLKLGRPAAALEALDAALAAAPDDLDAWSQRGVALSMLGHHAESLASHDRAWQRDPARAVDAYGRGNALAMLGCGDEAVAAYDDALRLEPHHAEAWSRRGGLLREAGRLEEATQSYEAALAHGGDETLNRFFLAAVDGAHGVAPPSPPRAYVEGLFDEYAAGFGDHVVDGLAYRAHVRLADGLATLRGARLFRAGLDLGCGSGLSGRELRPHADALDGVDVSSRMLERARASGAYGNLVHDDLASHLGTTTLRYDLVAAVDVFIYVGALDTVFAGVRRILEPGGLFCFTAEKAGPDEADGTLRPSLRHAHRREALETLAARHGFLVERIDEAPLREEQRRPIEGFYFYLRGP